MVIFLGLPLKLTVLIGTFIELNPSSISFVLNLNGFYFRLYCNLKRTFVELIFNLAKKL